MSRFLGVEANNVGLFYFISYSNVDSERVSQIIQTMQKYDIQVWYDGGILLGQKWAKEIADNIQNSEAVIMFISKNTFSNEETYVKKEYDIAIIRNKPIYIVFLDALNPEDIPNGLIGWWIDIQGLQNLNVAEYQANDDLVLKICKDLNYSLDESEKIKRLKAHFATLSKNEQERFVSEYFNMIDESGTFQTKATFFAQIQIIGMHGLKTQKKYNSPYFLFCDDASNKITISDTSFMARSEVIYHPSWGNAEALHLFRNGERLLTIGGICDICDDEKCTKLYYDARNDLLFISFISTPLSEEQKYMKDRNYNPLDSISVAIVEHPLDNAICHCYRDIFLIDWQNFSE